MRISDIWRLYHGDSDLSRTEYTALDPQVACELVIRARQTHGAPPPQQPQYGYGYGAATTSPISPQASNPAAALLAQALAAQQQPGGNANLMNLISSLDAPTLQKLLATLQQQQQHPSAAAPQVQPFAQQLQQLQSAQPDLATLLSGRAGVSNGQTAAGYNTATLGMAGLYGQPAGQHQQQPQQAQQPQLQNILETLGKYRH